MKKLIAMILALAMVLSVCVACGQEKPKTNVGGDDGETVHLTIGLASAPTTLDYDDNALTYWVEEQTGVELSFELYSGGTDVGTQISTTVAADQKLPDIILGVDLGDEVYRGYGQDGYFLDLSKYYEDRDGASKIFWTRFEETYTPEEQEQFLRRLKDPDTGAIYGVPSMDTTMVDVMDYQIWINTEWLDYLNLDMPTDTDSLYKVLKAFKTGDPNQNGKADELPLYGSQSSLGADVINWLVNLYLYFNEQKNFAVDDDGQIYAPFITDEYREAMKFIRKLIDEGLMLDTVFNAVSAEMPMITTPANGTAIVGVFAGHLNVHADYDNPILKQYKSMPLWSSAVFNDHHFCMASYITADCQNPDKAFELMMTLWSEEGSRRIRYGEYGVNWTDPDPGAVSSMGLPAEYKLLSDPLGQQNTCLWSGVSGTLCAWAELETAQLVDEQTEGAKLKQQMHAESYANYKAAAEKYNPSAENICPYLVYTAEEEADVNNARTACRDYYIKARTDFATGVLDPNSDSAWKKYVDELWRLGLQDWIDIAQVAYDRD